MNKIIKTSELSGRALDWTVAKCEGLEVDSRWMAWVPDSDMLHFNKQFKPSTDWAQGGKIIECEGISLAGKDPLHDFWAAMTQYGGHKCDGPTPLIAAMRCYCCAKLGNEVEIPEELL